MKRPKLSLGHILRTCAIRTQSEVARKLGITRSAVAQAERRALYKLAARLGAA